MHNINTNTVCEMFSFSISIDKFYAVIVIKIGILFYLWRLIWAHSKSGRSELFPFQFFLTEPNENKRKILEIENKKTFSPIFYRLASFLSRKTCVRADFLTILLIFRRFFAKFCFQCVCIAWPNVNPKINPNIIKYIVWSREKKKRLLIENKKKIFNEMANEYY